MARALGHPARITILRALAGQACVCGELVDALPLAQSTVSQHLRTLREAGWIQGTVDGPRTCYCLDVEAVRRFRSLLEPMLEEWAGAPCCSGDSGCV
ncbi:MAG: ArsR family transcriptional regulator [Gemmatimonadetes bacterium]|nr:MAG: ArsR family transcriptional regulator [Gemmatimonadota bacterium]